jgi:uncharacterized protein (DUF2225 family)
LSPKSLKVLITLLLGGLLLAGPGAAGATTLGQSDFSCAFCGQTFTDKIIRSTNVMGRDAEFRPRTMGLDPLPYYVHACPHCGFASRSEAVQLSEAERRDIGKFLAAYRESHTGGVSGAGKYEVLANIYILRKFPADKIAYAFQQAAWLADDSADDAAARRYRAATLEYLVKTLEDPAVEAKKLPILTYLAGELNRRLGRFDEALRWFARVKPDGPNLQELVAQQTQLAKKQDAGPDRVSAFDRGSRPPRP